MADSMAPSAYEIISPKGKVLKHMVDRINMSNLSQSGPGFKKLSKQGTVAEL
jgi:hypothetical protein